MASATKYSLKNINCFVMLVHANQKSRTEEVKVGYKRRGMIVMENTTAGKVGIAQEMRQREDRGVDRSKP